MKIKSLFSLIAFISAFNASSEVLMQRVVDEELINKINQSQPSPVHSVFQTEMDGIYEVHTLDRRILYTNKDAKYYFYNALLVDFKTKQNFTQARKEKADLLDWKIIPTQYAFVVKKGDGQRKLAVFTDPDCPYCKRFENDLQEVDNVTIYYFLLPIDNLHPNAKKKAISVWCSKDKTASWYDMMLRNKMPDGDATCEHPLDKVAKFAETFRIKATPTLINGNGNVLEGAPKKDQLKLFLDVRNVVQQ